MKIIIPDDLLDQQVAVLRSLIGIQGTIQFDHDPEKLSVEILDATQNHDGVRVQVALLNAEYERWGFPVTLDASTIRKFKAY